MDAKIAKDISLPIDAGFHDVVELFPNLLIALLQLVEEFKRLLLDGFIALRPLVDIDVKVKKIVEGDFSFSFRAKDKHRDLLSNVIDQVMDFNGIILKSQYPSNGIPDESAS